MQSTTTRSPLILRLKSVKTKTGLSRSSIYAFQKSNDFPTSVQLGARAVGWFEHEVDAWLASRPSKLASSNVR
jgi:prophage regulatory protein